MSNFLDDLIEVSDGLRDAMRLISSLGLKNQDLTVEQKALLDRLLTTVDKHGLNRAENPFRVHDELENEEIEKTVKELLELAAEKGGDEDAAITNMDQLVHDTGSQHASSTNNGGLQDQAAFLISRGWEREEIVKRVREEWE